MKIKQLFFKRQLLQKIHSIQATGSQLLVFDDKYEIHEIRAHRIYC